MQGIFLTVYEQLKRHNSVKLKATLTQKLKLNYKKNYIKLFNSFLDI